MPLLWRRLYSHTFLQSSPPIFPRLRVKEPNFHIDTNFRVLHEDEDILLVNKPAPLAVHPVGSYFELNLHT